MTISVTIGRTIEQASKHFLPINLESDTQGLLALPNRQLSKFNANCFSRLNCSDQGNIELIGTNRCLHVTRNDGFQLQESTYNDGLHPGNSIEFQLNAPCTEIALFHNLRISNGMAMITVDGQPVALQQHAVVHAYRLQHDNVPIPYSALDSAAWIEDSRGYLVDAVLARDLEPASHTIRLEIFNGTNSPEGTYKFDFRAIACRK